jgi:hypothetical protein
MNAFWVSVSICIIASSAVAQDAVNRTQSPFGASSMFGSSGGTEVLRHRDAYGSPCITIGGYARAHTINPHLYDHVIRATNSCPKTISLRVCYYQSEDCISIDVSGSETKEATLGTLPSIKDFRFDFSEKF